MDRFMAPSVFARVVEQGGFTAASRKLGLSASAVTKTIARLEDQLGTPLLNRTTRKLRATYYGQELYERCRRSWRTWRMPRRRCGRGRRFRGGGSARRCRCPSGG